MHTVKIVFAIVMLFVLSGVEAHFVLLNPPPRGPLNEDLLSDSPCASYNTVNTSAITSFPLSKLNYVILRQ